MAVILRCLLNSPLTQAYDQLQEPFFSCGQPLSPENSLEEALYFLTQALKFWISTFLCSLSTFCAEGTCSAAFGETFG